MHKMQLEMSLSSKRNKNKKDEYQMGLDEDSIFPNFFLWDRLNSFSSLKGKKLNI